MVRVELPLSRNPEGKPCMLVVNGAACGREECKKWAWQVHREVTDEDGSPRESVFWLCADKGMKGPRARAARESRARLSCVRPDVCVSSVSSCALWTLCVLCPVLPAGTQVSIILAALITRCNAARPTKR